MTTDSFVQQHLRHVRCIYSIIWVIARFCFLLQCRLVWVHYIQQTDVHVHTICLRLLSYILCLVLYFSFITIYDKCSLQCSFIINLRQISLKGKDVKQVMKYKLLFIMAYHWFYSSKVMLNNLVKSKSKEVKNLHAAEAFLYSLAPRSVIINSAALYCAVYSQVKTFIPHLNLPLEQ